jgi:hypothetical protein
MNYTVGVSAGEAVIATDNAIVSNNGGVVNKQRLRLGGCYVCKFEPSPSQLKAGSETCLCDLKTKCYDEKTDTYKHYKQKPKNYDAGK